MKKSKIKNQKSKIAHQKIKRQAPSQATASPLHNVLQQAIALHRAGRLPEAEALYRRILQKEPKHPDALQYLGMLASQVGNNGTAEELLRRSLAVRPNHAEALNNLGNTLQAMGKLDDAVASYRQALALKPNYAEAHYNLGNALRLQNKREEAIASFREALALHPNYFEACYNLGILLQTLGKQGEAEASLRRALALRPDFAGTYNNLGFVLQNQDKLAEAEANYRRALALQPDFAEALNNLGNLLHAMSKPEEAEDCYRRALDIRPDYVEALTNLGIALQQQDKLEEAATCHRRALALDPSYVDALHSLGKIFRTLSNLEKAEESFRRTLILTPDNIDALNDLGAILTTQGKPNKAIDIFRRTLALKSDYLTAHSNLLFSLNYLPGHSIADYLGEARHYGRKATAQVSEHFSNWPCPSNPEQLRVGLVSGDFRQHSVGYFLENLLANIDAKHIQLTAYPTSLCEDELTSRIRSRFIDWKPLMGMKDEAAARMIHDDGIHILVDLAGHTLHNRLPVFAWKPAPVQVSWLGYSASTGLQEMDYLLADPYVVPPNEEAHFTETIYRLPESYLCFSLPQGSIAVGSLPALKEGRITFGSFNNATKMNDKVVALWARVLHTVSDSRLFLKAKQFTDAGFCDSVRQRFAACDIPPERLQLEGFVSHRTEHLVNYNRVDIALDPFPYNGTTTSVEALWMGVPFITLGGNCFIGHVGESIAHNVGLPDWIAVDEEDYVAKAVAFASDVQALAALRAGLRRQLLASPLMDGARFARNFEAALWGMWKAIAGKRQAEGANHGEKRL